MKLGVTVAYSDLTDWQCQALLIINDEFETRLREKAEDKSAR